jgi:hypothetical protein
MSDPNVAFWGEDVFSLLVIISKQLHKQPKYMLEIIKIFL